MSLIVKDALDALNIVNVLPFLDNISLL